MAGEQLFDGIGVNWWKHTGVAATSTDSYPVNGIGSSSATYSSSALHLAREVLCYGFEITTAGTADTLTLGITNSAGTFAALTGMVFPSTAVGRFIFPKPILLSVRDFAAATPSLNLGARTGDTTVATIYFKKLA